MPIKLLFRHLTIWDSLRVFNFSAHLRTVVRLFRHEDMLQWYPDWADSVLYLEMGAQVIFATAEAPRLVAPCGWQWV